MTLFEKYAELLKKRFSDDFQEVSISLLFLYFPPFLTCHRSYLRMITCLCQYRARRNMPKSSMLAGITPKNHRKSKCKFSRDNRWVFFLFCVSFLSFPSHPLFVRLCLGVNDMSRFPCVLPFSQMYPLCCIDIRNFLNQFYFFANDDFSHPNVIDDTLKDVSILWLDI